MVPASTCQPRDATSTVCKSIPDISLSYTCSEKRANPICSKCEIYNIICGHCGSKFFAGRRLALPANSRAKKPLRAQISFTESNPNMENTKRACDKKTINCSKYCHRWSTMVHNCLLMVVHTASWLDSMFSICNPLHLRVWARGVLQATRIEFRQKNVGSMCSTLNEVWGLIKLD